jgi:hypothetical protein
MRILHSLALCTLLFFPSLVLGQQPSEPAPEPATIMGTVIDVRNDAIPEATVALSGPAPADHSSITADDNGFFAFRNLRPAVTYRLTVSARGFADWISPSIVLEPGQQLDLSGVRLSIAVVQTTVNAVSSDQLALEQVKIAQTQRVFGIFPNFYVIYAPNPAPLTTRLKYKLAFRTAFDPVGIAGNAFVALLSQAGDTPNYQQGAGGYAQRFGAIFTDSLTDIMIGSAILPSLLHQDPRYFYQGTGTIKSRLRHAIASPFVCKGDNGHNQFNLSSTGGDLASGALSNLYYPESNRGPGLVFRGAAITTGARMTIALAQEFVLRRFTTGAKKHP